ncbi:hypothetical protein V5799_022907, partial [Amblyomma americanum]
MDSDDVEIEKPPTFQPTQEDVANVALYAEYRMREKFKAQSPVGKAFADRGFVKWQEQSGDDLSKSVPYPCIWDDVHQDESTRAELRRRKRPYGKYVFTKEGCLAVSCRAVVDGVPVTKEAFLKEQKDR